MKKIYFADLTHFGTITNADTFPYGVACVASLAKHNFGDEIDVEIFKFSDELNRAIAVNVPDILCMSNYVWNFNLSKKIAQILKKEYPEIIIVFGGPNLPIERNGRLEFLLNNNYIDFYIKYEGEQSFSGLLKTLFENEFDLKRIYEKKSVIDNVIYICKDKFKNSQSKLNIGLTGYVEGEELRIRDLNIIPSPYLNGMLDKFFDQGLRPLVEFTRGCPYACTFCTDAVDHRSKVFKRSENLAKEELEYIASHIKKATDLVLADLNFGQYKEDLIISKYIRQTIDKYNWPRTITCSPGKSQAERVMECVKIINGDGDGIIKFSSSMQSADAGVLQAIKRTNLPVEKLKPIMDASNSNDFYTEYFTEIILGLPGDSVATHLHSLRVAIDELGMNIVNVHQLTLLEGSPMGIESEIEKHGFDIRFRAFVGCIGEYVILGDLYPIAEIEKVVVGNKSMNFDEWLQCRVLNLLVKIYIDRDYFLEIFGLLRRLNISAVDTLIILRDKVIPESYELNKIINKFIFKTKEPLHKTFEEAYEFTHDSSNIGKFKSGELGGNELLSNRAHAYLECMEELHLALGKAAKLILEKNGLLDNMLSEYIDEALIFSNMRKFDIQNLGEEIIGVFNYDFIRASNLRFNILPFEIKVKPHKIDFYFDRKTISEIEYSLNTWLKLSNSFSDNCDKLKSINMFEDGQLMFNIGKLYHNSNLRKLGRSAKVLF